VKEFRKSINIWRRCGQYKIATLWGTVYSAITRDCLWTPPILRMYALRCIPMSLNDYESYETDSIKRQSFRHWITHSKEQRRLIGYTRQRADAYKSQAPLMPAHSCW